MWILRNAVSDDEINNQCVDCAAMSGQNFKIQKDLENIFVLKVGLMKISFTVLLFKSVYKKYICKDSTKVGQNYNPSNRNKLPNCHAYTSFTYC